MPYTRKYFTTLLEFGTEGYAVSYRSDTAQGKSFLDRLVHGYFVGMESDTRLLRVFTPVNEGSIFCRRLELKLYKARDFLAFLPYFMLLHGKFLRRK